MAGYLQRLVSSLGAYQLADAVSKLIAIFLLPVYTGYIAPAGYGIVETLATFVIFVSILVRFGMIEAFLRFHFTDADRARRDALARRAVSFLLVTSTVGALALAIPAGPLSQLVTSERIPGTFRIAVLGIWSFTNLELAYALLRVDERLRAYATASLINVGLTIAASLVLVVGLGDGYQGLLIGNYGASTVVLIGLWWTLRRQLAPAGARPQRGGVAESLRALLHFGLPTVPAEASVYALSVVDRQYIIHQRGAAAAGLYSVAIKLAGAITFLVRAFQYAWPPLAYSVTDDAEAGRLYGLVTTYYVLICGWVIAGLTLESRWIVRLLAPHHGYLDAYRAVPWVSLGWAMYGLWVIFLVVAGRAKVTRRNLPAALAGLAVNVVLLLVLVPRYGIVGGGAALCGAYLAMLGAMWLLVRRAFPVVFEWRRLARVVLVAGGAAVAGELLLPTTGLAGFASRAAVFLAIPPLLWASGFAHRQELDRLRALARRSRGGRGAGPSGGAGGDRGARGPGGDRGGRGAGGPASPAPASGGPGS